MEECPQGLKPRSLEFQMSELKLRPPGKTIRRYVVAVVAEDVWCDFARDRLCFPVRAVILESSLNRS